MLGFVDEPLVAGGEDHLTDAIVEDITRQRVGEMRQIISTITPDQYELISRDVDGRARHPGRAGDRQDRGRPAPRRVAALREPGARARRRAGRRPERDVHPLHRAGAAGARRGRRRAAADRLADRQAARRDRRDPRARGAEGQRADGRRAAAAAVGPAEARGRRDGPECVAASSSPPSASARSATRPAASASASGSPGCSRRARSTRRSLVSEEEAISAVRKTREYQKLASRAWPRETPEGLVEKLFKNRARLERVAGDLLDADEIALLLASTAAVKRRDMTPTDVALLDEAHWLIDPAFRRFGHVVVDEAQNLTPMELRMTVRRARGQSLTILGDLSQRTADAGVSSWDARARRGGRGRARRLRAARSATACRTSSSRSPAALLPPGAPAPRGVREAPFPPVVVARRRRRASPPRARRCGSARSGASGSSRRARASTRCARAGRDRLRGRDPRLARARGSTCSTCTSPRAWSSTRSSSSSPRRSSPSGPTAASAGSTRR